VVFGQEEIDIILKNESGDLKIPEEPTSNYLDYIAEGEGSWKLVTEGDRGGKKSYSSTENMDTVSLPGLESEKVDNAQLELGQDKDAVHPKNYEEASLGAEIYATIKYMEKN